MARRLGEAGKQNALDEFFRLWHKRGVPMTLLGSQCMHGPGIGIHGLSVFGRATAPVGKEARVVIGSCLYGHFSKFTATQFRLKQRVNLPELSTGSNNDEAKTPCLMRSNSLRLPDTNEEGAGATSFGRTIKCASPDFNFSEDLEVNCAP